MIHLRFRLASCVRALHSLVAGSLLCLISTSQATAQIQTPLPVTILQSSGPQADGLIFLGPDLGLGGLPPVSGPEIIDNQGRIVWFMPIPQGYSGTDFRVQTYMGNPVLTWMQSANFGAANPGQAMGYILDNTYKVVATVKAGNGFGADQHEFQLTPQNTALIVVYNTLQTDLSSVGGSATGFATEGVVQEIDVASGAVLLEWHSLSSVPVSDSYAAVPATTTLQAPYDYFHINSVKLDTDGNLLISSRHTWTVYKVNRTTGALIWRLGGKKSDFTLGSTPFAWQHDAEAVDASTIRVFDNESNGVPVLPYSRVAWISHDDATMTASVVRTIEHPNALSILAEGSAQGLDNGDTFVEWGITGRFSEFDPSGQLLLDGLEAPIYGSYRGYRFAWDAAPTTSPTASVMLAGDGSSTVHAFWNGATDVASWEVMGGSAGGPLSIIASAPWNGLDTVIPVPGSPGAVEVVALNAAGTVVGTSAAVSAPFVDIFPTQPVSQTVETGDTVVFSASATGTAPSYQWLLNGSPVFNGTSGGTTISGATTSTLVINGATSANAGSYTCVATLLGNTESSDAATLTLASTADPGRLINVSSRAVVGAGDGALIMGFVNGGSQATGTESLLIRASGPALAPFGVSGFLADPELLVSPANVANIAAKVLTAWGGNTVIADAAAAVGAFTWTDPTSLDAATLHNFRVGGHNAVIVGASGDTGVALAEVYDATPEGTYTPLVPHLTNVSARAQVGAGANVLIAGFVIGGSTSRTVLVRASGPALVPFGVQGTLADPQVQLSRSNADGTSTPLGANSGWAGSSQIATAAASVGAFSWGSVASADSALLVTLPPGAYTAEVSGASGDTGVGLVEVYEVP